jgi:hypothetical protein
MPLRPGEFSGSDWREINRLSDEIRRAQAEIVTLKGRVTEASGSGRRQNEPGSLLTFHFKSMSSDYIICRSWDGTNEGEIDIPIAKPPELRFESLVTETIDGTEVTYDSWDYVAQTRTAHITGPPAVVEAQVIVPRYLEWDAMVDAPGAKIIFAEYAPTFVEALSDESDPDSPKVPVGLVDKNVAGRAWART